MPDVGVELIARGWSQGKIVAAGSTAMTWQRRQDTGEWIDSSHPLGTDDLLVVVSHDCDIERDLKREPRIEFMRAFWTSNRGSMREAGSNSIRRFLLRREATETGDMGLIADASVRLHLDKRSLLDLEPLPGLDEEVPYSRQLFQNWLAARYNRPTVPNEIQRALVSPVETAMKEMDDTHPLIPIRECIDEIRYLVLNESAPYQVDFVFVATESPDLAAPSYEDAAELAAWLVDVLREGGGLATVNHWELLDYGSISVREYRYYTKLRLDYLSIPDHPSAPEETGAPVPQPVVEETEAEPS